MASIRSLGLKTVRLAVVDQHALSRAKMLSPEAAIAAMSDGLDFSGAIYSLDTGNQVFVPPFAAGGGLGLDEMTGFPDLVLVPDPLTFRVLPWAPRTGWVMGNVYFNDGRPAPFDSRGVLQRALADLEGVGYGYLAGLEVEFYLTRVLDRSLSVDTLGGPAAPGAPPLVEALAHGYCYQSDDHQDQIEEILAVLADNILGVSLPLRTMEDEWGPGQCEFTFSPMLGIEGADAMMLFKSAVKQVSRRLGLHATFMCRPGLPSFFSSGWHLHQSLVTPDGGNAFATAPGSGDVISDVGRQFIGGILEHAGEASVFTTPTVNGYRRRKPNSLAPDRATWGFDNRAAMMRVQGGEGDPTTHVENRIGEPAANPYLYLASNIAAGLDGIRRNLEPPPPVTADPYATEAPPLPGSLREAVDALDADQFYRSMFGATLVDYLVMMKRAEIRRYEDAMAADAAADLPGSDVSEWEMREYFEFF